MTTPHRVPNAAAPPPDRVPDGPMSPALRAPHDAPRSAEQLALLERIELRDARLAVIGLGFVGTPVAAAFAAAGFDVTGIDIDTARASAVDRGRVPFEGQEPGLAELLAEVVAAGRLRATTDYAAIAGADAVLVAVETPVDADHRPRYTALAGALASLGPHLRPGTLVVIESTLAPGTMRRLVVPALAAASGLAVPGDLLVAHCPERVMPGRLLANLKAMSRVVGGVTAEAAEVARALYGTVVEAELDTADDLTAELVKTGENAYRDVQIAFANEMALLCEALGADVWRVRELLNRSPGRHMHLPGGGVGGHCIPKDPWLLISDPGRGFAARLIPAARAVNDGMPHHVAGRTLAALTAAGISPREARVAVLGASYLEESDDERNAPTHDLVAALTAVGVDVRVHDPWVARYAERPVADVVDGCDAVVVMVAHAVYRALDWAALRERARGAVPALIDARRAVDAGAARAAGWRVGVIGVGAAARAGAEEGAGDEGGADLTGDRP